MFLPPSPMVLETGPGSAPLVSSSSRTLKKKIGNFFAFKKPKSSRGSRCEKEPEGSTAAPRSRRSMLSDILRAPSKAGEPGKALSKSEEGALSTEPEHSQTPEAARRIRPKYSREGKSQSLILLPGEDEEALGVRQDKVSSPKMSPWMTLSAGWVLFPPTGGWWDEMEPRGPLSRSLTGWVLCSSPRHGLAVPPQKRHLEKSDGELPNSFEQRVHVMLHRMGVTKGLGAEGKKQQVGAGASRGTQRGGGPPGQVTLSCAATPLSPSPLQGDHHTGCYVVCLSVCPSLMSPPSLSSPTPHHLFLFPCRAKTARSRKPGQMVRAHISSTHGCHPTGLPGSWCHRVTWVY